MDKTVDILSSEPVMGAVKDASSGNLFIWIGGVAIIVLILAITYMVTVFVRGKDKETKELIKEQARQTEAFNSTLVAINITLMDISKAIGMQSNISQSISEFNKTSAEIFTAIRQHETACMTMFGKQSASIDVLSNQVSNMTAFCRAVNDRTGVQE